MTPIEIKKLMDRLHFLDEEVVRYSSYDHKLVTVEYDGSPPPSHFPRHKALTLWDEKTTDTIKVVFKLEKENKTSEKDTDDDRKITEIQFYKKMDQDFVLHRTGASAWQNWDHDPDELWSETWYTNGQVERPEGGPAYIRYDRDKHLGRYVSEKGWYKSGKQHRDNDLPAKVSHNVKGEVTSETWFKNGMRHRDNGPADVWCYQNGQAGAKSWLKDGELHRDHGPAKIWYHENGKVHKMFWCKLTDKTYYHKSFISFDEEGRETKRQKMEHIDEAEIQNSKLL